MVEQDPKRKISRLICMVLRVAEIICGSVSMFGMVGRLQLTLSQVVLILIIILLRNNRKLELGQVPFQSYLSVSTAGLSVIFALLFMPQNNYFFRYFIVDLILCVFWFTSFALLLLRSGPAKDEAGKTIGCGQELKELGQIAMGGSCNSWRATWGFAFLSGCVWLGTFLVGFWVMVMSRKKKGTHGKQGGIMNR